MHIDAKQLAINLLETLRQDDSVPMNVQDCVANAIVLLDTQDGEDFYDAIRFAYEQIGKADREICDMIDNK